MDNNLETNQSEVNREQVLEQIASVESRLEEGSSLVSEIMEKIRIIRKGLEFGEISDQQANLMVENIKSALDEIDGNYRKIIKDFEDLKAVA